MKESILELMTTMKIKIEYLERELKDLWQVYRDLHEIIDSE